MIDYGAISRDEKDCTWPHNIFLSLLIFAHETISGQVEDVLPLWSPRLNPEALPEPYRSALWRLFATPSGEWRFARLRDDLLQDSSAAPVEPAGVATALRALEEACGLYRSATQEWRNRAIQAEARVQELQSLVESFASPKAAGAA